MKSSELRQELHGYIEQADDKVLQAIKVLVEPSIASPLTGAQKKELDKRRKDHLAGKSLSYTWAEAEKMIKARKK